jgi:hypothetical protein
MYSLPDEYNDEFEEDEMARESSTHGGEEEYV